MALQFPNLSFNNLEGKAPKNGIFSNFTGVHLEGNSKLCYEFKCRRSNTNKAIVISVAVVASICILLISITLVFYFRRNTRMVVDAPDSFKGQHIMVTYEQLCSATKNFHKDNLIGSGSFGSVYKGYLILKGQTQEIAVKTLDMDTTDSLPSFLVGCAALHHLRHRNLVKLITSCSRLDYKNKEFLSLVYEYMKNGSLEKWITNGMCFEDRLNVAIGIACGLSYLHHECVVAPVVHYDLKPSNVLLDEDFTAKIGDFELASMLVDKDQSLSYTHVLKGSMGYIPPEYGMGTKPSTKGDVYSYDIMLMEIFTGKSPIDEMCIGGLSLKTWVQSAFTSHLDKVFDPHMHENVCDESCTGCQPISHYKIQLDCLKKVFEVALSCTNDSPKGRITIIEALCNLKNIQDTAQKPSPLMNNKC